MNTQIYLMSPDGHDLRRLTDGGEENNWLGDWTRDGRFLSVTSNSRRADTMDAFLIDAESGQMQLIAEVGDIQGVSRDGHRIVHSRTRYRGDNDLYLLDLPSRRETLLTPHDPPGSFSGAISPDGTTVYLSSDQDRELAAFARIRVDTTGGVGPIEVVAERPDAELLQFKLSHAGDEALLNWTVAGRAELTYVALPSGTQRPGPTLPAELVNPDVQYAPDDRTLAASMLGSTHPVDVWSWDRRSGRMRQLTMTPHSGVDLAQLVQPKLVRYRAHDGLELSGWLYAPPGTKGAAPYVLSFHGGPAAQEVALFRPDYQALLLQGIGVFAPNVRGSSGFGKKFVELDNGELRFDAIRDIKTSADYLIAQGVARQGHLGIMGRSYGGYMTMAGVTEYPELFRAAVNFYGIVNFATFYAHTEPWMAASQTTEYGDPRTQADLLARLSPIHKLHRIKAALMVQHGANDTNVPVVEAEQIVQAMKTRGLPVEYILFPDEGHGWGRGWSKENNRIRSIVSTVAFFRHHLMESSGHSAP
jgi:dipeptidyl aminopeptidase/acylaminoacyl peptidase